MVKAGDVVMIYEDPVTAKKPEGKAKLIRKCSTPAVEEYEGLRLEFWIVIFEGDEGQVYRAVRVEEKA